AMISRIDAHKGIPLILEAADELFKNDIQFVFLGQGDDTLKAKLAEVSAKYPEKFQVKFTFDDNLAHLMEAGSDMFLIPSDYEPCGLNFMYSLSYGSFPIAHHSGGLNELAIDYTTDKENGNSILFDKWEAKSMLEAIGKGLELYKNKEEWFNITSRLLDSELAWGENAIVAMINNGKANQMPAQAGKLTDPQLHVLASYVWGLSNNPAKVAAK
ncbi:MAG: hypothetical protein RIS02_1598, partial [Pseudomonadota bacterium]